MADRASWLSIYDHGHRLCTIVNTDRGGWSGLKVDERVSDPGGSFTVYVTSDDDRIVKTHARPPVPVKIVLTLNERGDVAHPHPDFNQDLIGGRTIWPYQVAGRHADLDHFMWVSQDRLWRCEGPPRAWAGLGSGGRGFA